MQVSGKVLDAQGGAQAVELIAIPQKPGQKAVTAQNDGNGDFSLALLKGNWVLTTWKPGWRSVQRRLEVNADLTGVDFTIAQGMEGYDMEGVLLKPGAIRLRDVAVQARLEDEAGHGSHLSQVDPEGRFGFSQLKPGIWQLTLLQAQQIHTPELTRLSLYQPTVQRIELSRIHHEKSGRSFFASLTLLLLGLFVAYVFLHQWPKTHDQASHLLGTLESTLQMPALQNPSATPPLSQNAELLDQLGSIRSNWARLAGSSGFDQNLKAEGDRLVKGLGEQVAANRAAELRVYLKALQSQLEGNSSYFWQQQPWRSLEVLLWGLAGILVNLILTVGRYLRWRNFYREGIPLHLAQLITVPILALVFVYLLSSAALSVDVAAAGKVELRLTDPLIQAAISFAIGSRPWALWALIQGTADRVIAPKTQASNNT